MRCAVLDSHGVLIGEVEKEKTEINDLSPGDLPLDGSYRFDKEAGQFVPIGAVMHEPEKPAVSMDMAVYLMITAINEGKPLPAECLLWADWFKKVYNL